MSANLTEITSITAGSFAEKEHRSFSLVKTNLIFGLLQNLLQSWSTLYCISLECSPINGSLRHMILILQITLLKFLRSLSKPVQELLILYIWSKCFN